MRRPQGYALLTDPEKGIKEADTFSCSHCNRIVHVKPKADPADMGGLCKCCMRLICPACVGKACDVLERKLERQEASYQARRSYGLAD